VLLRGLRWVPNTHIHSEQCPSPLIIVEDLSSTLALNGIPPLLPAVHQTAPVCGLSCALEQIQPASNDAAHFNAVQEV